MIEKIENLHHRWPDFEHHTQLVRRYFEMAPQGKWITLQEPGLAAMHHTAEWYASTMEYSVEFEPSTSASDDELFEKAAAEVNYKIEIDRKILGGAPCIAGTRIPVYAILQLVEAGYNYIKILKSFPALNKDDLEAALRFSVIVMER